MIKIKNKIQIVNGIYLNVFLHKPKGMTHSNHTLFIFSLIVKLERDKEFNLY